MICTREECENEFIPTTHNNIYCSDECCKIATLEKARKVNKERRDRLSGKKRICKMQGCNNILSRYNDGSICEQCKGKNESQKRDDLLKMLGVKF